MIWVALVAAIAAVATAAPALAVTPQDWTTRYENNKIRWSDRTTCTLIDASGACALDSTISVEWKIKNRTQYRLEAACAAGVTAGDRIWQAEWVLRLKPKTTKTRVVQTGFRWAPEIDWVWGDFRCVFERLS